MTKQLQEFIQRWNTSYYLMSFNNDDSRHKLTSAVNNIMMDMQYSEPRDYVGLSTVGNYEYLLALKKLGFHEPPSNRTQMIFFTGHLWEAMLIESMKDYGLPIHSEQQAINYAGFPGHIDCMLEDGVLELKTMSDSSFKRFTANPKSNMNYVYQLGCYTHCMNTDKSGWLCLNKQTFEIAYVPYPIEVVDNVLESVEAKSKCLACVNKINDLQYIYVPEPRGEVYKKENTGKFLIPAAFNYSVFSNAVYNIVTDTNGYGKQTKYVDNLKTFTETLDWLNNYPHRI